MGADQGKLNTVKMYVQIPINHKTVNYNVYFRASLLRQSISRINIHRSKKLNSIAKKKDDICKHLESGNEMNAKIWVS